MRCFLLSFLALLACGCGRLAQYGDPRLRPEPPPVDASASPSAAAEPVLVQTKGTVRRIDTDGGFWGVSADDGRRYRLESLPPVYQKDGTRIRFTGRVRGETNLAPWLTVLDLTEVSGV